LGGEAEGSGPVSSPSYESGVHGVGVDVDESSEDGLGISEVDGAVGARGPDGLPATEQGVNGLGDVLVEPMHEFGKSSIWVG